MSSIKINDGQIKVERYSETTALLGVMGRSAEMNAEELRTVAFAALTSESFPSFSTMSRSVLALNVLAMR